MIVLGVYGRINKKIISKKLGIAISNLPDDWEAEIQEDIIDEIYYRNYKVEKYSKNEMFKNLMQASPVKPYNLKDILSFEYEQNIFKNYDAEKENLKELAKNLICIDVGIDEFENSMIKHRNSILADPTCEMSYVEKFIRLFNFISRGNDCNLSGVSIIYNSDKNLESSNILSHIVCAKKQNFVKNNKIIIDDLLTFGNIVDKFLESEADFWKLDYIMDAISFDNEYNSYHLFKVYSIIEMLIIDSRKNGKTAGDIGKKLPLFMNGIRTQKYSENEKEQLAELIRVIRNKIGHGDFMKINEKLDEFKKNFMANFSFDEFEHSEKEWIFITICCILDEILKDILWKMLKDKGEIDKIKNA